MRIVKFFAILVAVSALVGCAHPIVITPDLKKIEPTSADQPIKKNVAYYISEDVRSQEVITPGGGGDKVSYIPYRDIETAFYKMLSNVFANVTKLKTAADADAIKKNEISYVITPQLLTHSSSPSPFTWPPTQFSVDLTCNISDAAGKAIGTKKVVGQGRAEFDEFKKDHSLAGKRAGEDALKQMQNELFAAKELR